MYSDEFESAFSDFLDRHEYDEAENYLFSMVRLAFAAGWRAAGGQPPKAERLYQVIFPGQNEKEEQTPPKNILPLSPEALDTGGRQ